MDRFARYCDTENCAAWISTPEDQQMLLATLNATATEAGWVTVEPNGGAEVYDRCPACLAGRGPVLETGECPCCHGRTTDRQDGARCQYCGHTEPHQDAEPASCAKCLTEFDPDDTRFVDSQRRYGDSPFCGACVDRCHDSEIADHWCVIDEWRQEQRGASL